MKNLSKKSTLALIFILVFGLLLVESCVAPVTVPANPSVAPEIISVEIHHNPIWNPPVYTTNPYTGDVNELYSGSWTYRGTIEVKIKNRPFTSYTDKNGNYINVYYSISWKFNSYTWWPSATPYTVYQSDSEYTAITLTYGGYYQDLYVSPGQVIDIRVQAVIGYFDRSNMVFEGEGSEWAEFTATLPTSNESGTSTVKPPSTSNPNSTPSQTTSQQNPLQPNLLIILFSVCIIVVLLSILVYLLFSRQRKTNPVDGVGVLVREVKT